MWELQYHVVYLTGDRGILFLSRIISEKKDSATKECMLCIHSLCLARGCGLSRVRLDLCVHQKIVVLAIRSMTHVVLKGGGWSLKGGTAPRYAALARTLHAQLLHSSPQLWNNQKLSPCCMHVGAWQLALQTVNKTQASTRHKRQHVPWSYSCNWQIRHVDVFRWHCMTCKDRQSYHCLTLHAMKTTATVWRLMQRQDCCTNTTNQSTLHTQHIQ